MWNTIILTLQTADLFNSVICIEIFELLKKWCFLFSIIKCLNIIIIINLVVPIKDFFWCKQVGRWEDDTVHSCVIRFPRMYSIKYHATTWNKWNKTKLGNDIKMYNETAAIPEHYYLITFIVFIINQYGE